MATYDLTSSIPSSSSLAAGDILNCPYSGSYIALTLPAGAYTLETWGAQGGAYNTTAGTAGNGGYSTGDILFTEDTTVYLYTGGAGSVGSSAAASTHSGGFNGGGTAYSYAGSGGGGSDIRIGSTSLYARVIVAGGGGGTAYSNNLTSYSVLTGGGGGGLTGTPGGYGSRNQMETASGSTAGTQTSAGTNASTADGSGGSATTASFGEGAGAGCYSASYASGGGGGGWYGGGVGRSYYAAGSGGSGYLYTAAYASNYPSGCLLNSNYYLTNTQTIDGTEQFYSPTGELEFGHFGDGYVRITVISIGSVESYIVTSNLTDNDYTINPEGEETILEHATYNLIVRGDNLENISITDNGIDVTASSVIIQEDLNLINGIIETSYDTNDYSYSSLTNVENAYTAASTSEYATMTLKTGSGSESYVYFLFDCSSIPNNAIITEINLAVRCAISSTSRLSSYTVQPFSGTTSKATAQSMSTTSSSSHDLYFTLDSCTREELDDIKVKYYAKRSSSGGGGGSSSSSITMQIYGAVLTVAYTIPYGNTYLLYTIGDVIEDHSIVVATTNNILYLRVNGAWTQLINIYKKVNGMWREQPKTILTTDNIQYLLQGDIE